MAQSDAGRVIILPKGEYSATTNYEILDLVTYSSSTWLCKQSCIGITPTEGAYWMLFGSAAQKATESTLGLVMPDGTTITIDENGVISSVGGDAENVTYDNTDSGFTADNVQDAIDEVASDLNTIDGSITTINGTLSLHDERITALEEGGEVTALDTWLNKGNITTKYSTLADVLASQSAINQLMRIHASVDYLITWSATDSSIISTICSNANAMGAIGEYDYASDKLLAVSSWESAIIESAYVESVLREHVPTMTSNTAPSGEVIFTDTVAGATYDAYKVFDGNDSTLWTTNDVSLTNTSIGYKFTVPICVKKIHIKDTYGTQNKITSALLEASNDGSNWTNVQTLSIPSDLEYDIAINNNAYYIMYRLHITGTGGSRPNVYTLQFLGRKMSIYVPKLTSNDGANGKASASSIYSSTSNINPWEAFDGNDSTNWCASGSTNEWLQYEFNSPKRITKFILKNREQRVKNYKILASNDGFVSDSHELYSAVCGSASTTSLIDIPQNVQGLYKFYRILVTDTYSGLVAIYTLNFYGSDYSESIRATDVVLSDGTSVEDALSSGSSSGEDWKLFGTTTGTDAIYIPSGCKEILAMTKVDETYNVWYSTHIPTVLLDSSAKRIRNGSSYTTSNLCEIDVLASSTTISVSAKYVGGNSKLNLENKFYYR